MDLGLEITCVILGVGLLFIGLMWTGTPIAKALFMAIGPVALIVSIVFFKDISSFILNHAAIGGDAASVVAVRGPEPKVITWNDAIDDQLHNPLLYIVSIALAILLIVITERNKSRERRAKHSSESDCVFGSGVRRCSCGAESPVLEDYTARERWHERHKAEVLAAGEQERERTV